MRRSLTKPEIHLWCALRGGGLDGLRFRKQHPAGPYILDFFCSEARLAVEIDGTGHADPKAKGHDNARDVWLAREGIRTLRFSAAQVLRDTDGVLAALLETARERIGR